MRPRSDGRTFQSPAPLEKHFREIVVGSGRSQEPYIIAFHYSSDNVSGSTLGTLFGFFEVEIHDQDAAYIVNFLASVAKKEYFANPRRSPVESFEVALHKINVALAEIVKHGNISWLGHLHGAIGSITQDTLHFSVTGEGELYLAREEGFRSISTGLAEAESEPHPLKTFTEVSSGVLYDGDSIFALSPSLWSLFSPEDLRRNLNRLGPAGFEQFLRTALINELPVAAVALVTCSAPVVLAKPTKATAKPVADLGNVWSDTPFLATQQSRRNSTTEQISSSELKREEYTDKKTGHIYIQAIPTATFEEPSTPWQERWTLLCHRGRNWSRARGIAIRKTSRRLSKEGVLLLAASTHQFAGLRRLIARKVRGTKRTAQNHWQHWREQRAAQSAQRGMAEYLTPRSTESAVRNETRVTEDEGGLPERAVPVPEHPDSTESISAKPYVSPSHRIHAIGSNMQSMTKLLSVGVRTRLYSIISGTYQKWTALAPKQRWIVLGTVLIVSSSVWIFLSRSTPPITEDQTPVVLEVIPVTFPPSDEPHATLLTNERSVLGRIESKALGLSTINAKLYLVTERNIIDLESQESISAPETLRLAAAMDDLDALFVLGQSGKLYLYSVATKKYTTNDLPLPTGAQIDAIGAYLTYLYILDQQTGVIYRFPRAEGGFGSPTTWSKETLNVKPSSAMSVYENIAFAGNDGRPLLYSRGKDTRVTFSGTAAPVRTDALAFDPKSGDLLALDRETKRIVRWSATGTLITQYFHDSLSSVETFSVGPEKILTVVRTDGTFAFTLP